MLLIWTLRWDEWFLLLTSKLPGTLQGLDHQKLFGHKQEILSNSDLLRWSLFLIWGIGGRLPRGTRGSPSCPSLSPSWAGSFCPQKPWRCQWLLQKLCGLLLQTLPRGRSLDPQPNPTSQTMKTLQLLLPAVSGHPWWGGSGQLSEPQSREAERGRRVWFQSECFWVKIPALPFIYVTDFCYFTWQSLSFSIWKMVPHLQNC